MKFYYFGGDFDSIDKVYDAKFDGNLFLYDSSRFEHFTEIVHNASKIRKDFKYMVAIRPYVISPQYLFMISRNIYNYFGDILEINLVSGWAKQEEEPHNFFVGEINDNSSSVEKSNYLIKYLEVLGNYKKSMKNDLANIYVSVTNEFTLDASNKFNGKMVVPYYTYKKYAEKINTNNIVLSITPIIDNSGLAIMDEDRGNDLVHGTEEEIVKVLKDIKDAGVYGVLLVGFDKDQARLFDFVSKYKELI